jgi:hypothetical protein
VVDKGRRLGGGVLAVLEIRYLSEPAIMCGFTELHSTPLMAIVMCKTSAVRHPRRVSKKGCIQVYCSHLAA